MRKDPTIPNGHEKAWLRGRNDSKSLVPEESDDQNTLLSAEARQEQHYAKMRSAQPVGGANDARSSDNKSGGILPQTTVTSQTSDKNGYRYGHVVHRASYRTGDGDTSKSAENPFTHGYEERGLVQPGAVHVMGTGSQVRNEENTRETYEDYMNERSQSGFELDIASNSESIAEKGVASAYEVEDPSVVHEAEIINVKRQRAIRLLMASGIIIAVVAVVVPVVMLFGNGSSDSNDTSSAMFTVIIENLCSPRHMEVHDESLFVPEAGVGPIQIAGDRESEVLCLPSSNGISGSICFGNTGRVSRFNLDGSSTDGTLLTGLFSARPTEGRFTNQVYGPSGVHFDQDGTMFTIIGLGYVNATEVALQDPGLAFASVLRGNDTAASPWVPVFKENYAEVLVPETNPFHIHIHNGTTYVVDAGADLLYAYLNVETAGIAEPDRVVVLPTIENIPAVEPNPRGGRCNDVTPPNGPSFCGKYQDGDGNWLYSASAVPTAVRVNPDEPNRLYVSFLGGAIWNEPVSGLFSMDLVDGLPDAGTIKLITGGLWAVIDFAFYQGHLFVLETNPGGSVPFNGRLSRVTVDSNGSIANMITITEDLFEPASLAMHDNFIYVSNNTFNMGIDDCNGQILRAKLM